jgi:hypothetical protein
LGGARSRFDKGFCAEVVDRLSAELIDRLEELVTGRDGFLVELKSDPGPLGLDTLLEEIVKLGRAKAIGLPADLLSGYSEKLVAAWRARGGLLPVGFAGQSRGQALGVVDLGDERPGSLSALVFGGEVFR